MISINHDSEYKIDFVIPQGPPGPNPPVCYIDYGVSSNRFLTIKDYKIFNSNGEFSVSNNNIIVEPGTYEITFCGRVDVNNDFESPITVALHEDLGSGFSQIVGDMSFVLQKGTKLLQFSETKLITFNNKKTLMAFVSNNNAVTVTVSMGSLILKKVLTS